MPKIYELDPHVADLIAAGEVVERPASVIKELMENSIDAGAGKITVEIKNGGRTFMRVTDDGCGIAPEDVQTAFLRHATSKLKDETGLEAIGTLGFRGEALAAIASVSRIEIFTRERGNAEGVRLTLEAGVVTDTSPFGAPEGTTIIVSDLFYNTPARQKFMKTDRAEASAIGGVVLRTALSHPGVSVRYVKDGAEECNTAGDLRADSCIYTLFGRDFYNGLIDAQSEGESVAVTGYVSKPDSARGNRNYQFFFLNGRHIRSRVLQAALEQAYANTLTSGRYPACVLYITARYGDVDVNVHPAKTEVRFVSEKQVFDGVYYAALGALESSGTQPVAADSEPAVMTRNFTHTETRLPETRSGEAFKTGTADEFRKAYSKAGFKTAIPGTAERTEQMPIRNESREIYQTRFTPERQENYKPQDTFRVVGEAMDTYIIAEKNGSLWLIDKHAAHERIRFDALRAGGGEAMSQALIEPVICRLGAENTELLLENTQLLETLGFAVENFGADAAAVRRVPSDLDPGDAESVLSEICMQLRQGGVTESARRDNILKTVACKSAVKAGDSSDIIELEALARRVFSGEVRYCPHGRPVAFEITQQSVLRGFKRT